MASKSKKRRGAKSLLTHYFRTVSHEPLTWDCYTEIEDIVDLIIDAAKEEIKSESQKR